MGQRKERAAGGGDSLLSLYVCVDGGVALLKPPVTLTFACLLSNLTDKTAVEPLS